MVAQLAGEARTVGNSVEEMEEDAEELIAKILGQRCSRKDWVTRSRRHFSFVSISFPVAILPLCPEIIYF
jgi:hypothetical protein